MRVLTVLIKSNTSYRSLIYFHHPKSHWLGNLIIFFRHSDQTPSRWSRQSSWWCASTYWRVADGNGVQKTELLAQESAMLYETIKLWVIFPGKSCCLISDNVPSFWLIVTMECTNRKCQQLGLTDVASTDLLGQCAKDNHSTSSIHSHAVLSSPTHGYPS